MQMMVAVAALRQTLRKQYEWLDLYQAEDELVIEKSEVELCRIDIPHPVWFQLTPSAPDDFIKLITDRIEQALEDLKKKALPAPTKD